MSKMSWDFEQAGWYDRSIDWTARLKREIPLLVEMFGAGEGRKLLDAGCGTGRHAVALAARGHSVVGVDASPDMLTIASEHARSNQANVRFVQGRFDQIGGEVGGNFDGVYCIGNSLAAAAGRTAMEAAIARFASVLRPGGRLFVQVLNFEGMRQERPCVRGPRVVTVDGVEYVSTRTYHFGPELVDIVNLTLWREGRDWKKHCHAGVLYPVRAEDLRTVCAAAGLTVRALWGDYAKTPFDVQASQDLILLAERAVR